MDEDKITGACISIWQRNSLNQDEANLLSRYAKYVNLLTQSFTIQVRSIKSINLLEKIQIFVSIGYLPKEEILICGFNEVIFSSAVAILRDKGGYLSVGIGATKYDFSTLKGSVFKIRKFESIYPKIEIYTYHLIDWQFILNYFSRLNEYETLEIYSLTRFRQLEKDYPNATYVNS